VDRLIYTALSGMRGSMAQQQVIASNMANAQTIGFRAERVRFTPIVLEGPQLEARVLADGAVQGADMTAGTLTTTGRALDVALDGSALLTVQAADGGEAYTRRGDLSVSASGVLQNGDGRPVMGSGGPITVPPGAILSIRADGSVLAADPATPDAPPAVLDRIKLASPQGSPLAKALDGLFRVPGANGSAGGVLPADEAATVTAGALEGSNVDTAGVLVEMIENQRLFDMRSKLVATARELDQGGASLMRLG
jgi:flagellar basal-body rod protein FlgF